MKSNVQYNGARSVACDSPSRKDALDPPGKDSPGGPLTRWRPILGPLTIPSLPHKAPTPQLVG